jgi:hypothetical protein
MKTCSVCSFANLDTDVFCRQCGLPLAVTVRDATEKLPSPELLEPITTWGESSLTSSAGLILQVFETGDQIFLPPTDRIVIGRLSTPYEGAAFVDLTPFGSRAKSVSRRHALLEISHHVQIMDLGSANGTFLHGNRVSTEHFSLVRSGDELRFGDFVTGLYFGLTGAGKST